MSEAKVPEKGTFLWKFSKKFNFAAEKIIPDSFVFCVILMIQRMVERTFQPVHTRIPDALNGNRYCYLCSFTSGC